MVTDRLRDGVRIAQLLASEVTGDQGRLKTLSVADADTDVEPTLDGTLAYRITREDEPIVRPARSSQTRVPCRDRRSR